MKKKNNRTGFTLMEVLVAMVILAIIASIMLNVFANNTRQQAHLEDKTLATIVADNRLSEIYAGQSSASDEVEMAGRKWRVATKISSQNGLKKIEVQVFENDNADKPLASLTGFTEGDK